MLLRKAQGGVSIGEYTWDNDGDIVDVDEKTAGELLAIRGHDFEVVSPDEVKPRRGRGRKAAEAADEASDGDEPPESEDSEGRDENAEAAETETADGSPDDEAENS